jgi:hypothetical protein
MPAAALIVLVALASCKKNSTPTSGSQAVTSLLFDVNSPEARKALATPVSFIITEANYDQWEQAQRSLDALPRSALAGATSAGGNPIDRAVATLEASPRARAAIERTGLSVRDFVLETVALAQAAEAGAGKPPGGVTVPPENVQFVQRYQSRIVQARAESRATRARIEPSREADTMNVGVQPTSSATQLQQSADVQRSDSASVGEQGRESDSVRRAGQAAARPKPPTDTARDTIPR